MIQVYTGKGKGKTTAGLGLSIRAFGQGLKVAIVYFDKGGENYGGSPKREASLNKARIRNNMGTRLSQ